MILESDSQDRGLEGEELSQESAGCLAAVFIPPMLQWLVLVGRESKG